MRTIAALSAVILGLLLAACGDDEETTAETATVSVTTPTASPSSTTTTTGEGTQTPEGGSGEGAEAPVLAAAAVLTTEFTTKQACETFVTENFIATAYGSIDNCVAAREDQLASQITVDKAESESLLVVIPTGGPYDGAKVEVQIVEEDGRYLVDGLTADIPAGP